GRCGSGVDLCDEWLPDRSPAAESVLLGVGRRLFRLGGVGFDRGKASAILRSLCGAAAFRDRGTRFFSIGLGHRAVSWHSTVTVRRQFSDGGGGLPAV